MTDKELIQALREHAEWAQANEWEVPIALGDDLKAAADRLELRAMELGFARSERDVVQKRLIELEIGGGNGN
jgi:hypothetical protein